MSKHTYTTFTCEFCDQKSNNNLIGICYNDDNYVGFQEKKLGEASHHICKACIKDLAEFVEDYEGKTCHG
mgnify:FL=1